MLTEGAMPTFQMRQGFRALRELGRGSGGSVWLCEEKTTLQQVALKRFADVEPEIQRLALREARLLHLSRHHPNIVKLLDAFKSSSGRFYLLFEYVPCTLYRLVQNYPHGLPRSAAKSVAWQLLQALSFLHKHKVVHRDLKPANVLIADDGTAKLCDFGFAKVMHPGTCQVNSNYVVTRWYRAPEILLDDATYGSGVDIWALGGVFIEMVTGMALFPGHSQIDQLCLTLQCFNIGQFNPRHRNLLMGNRHLAALVTASVGAGTLSLAERYPELDADMLSFAEACLEPDPERRPSADQLMALPLFAGMQRAGLPPLHNARLDRASLWERASILSSPTPGSDAAPLAAIAADELRAAAASPAREAARVAADGCVLSDGDASDHSRASQETALYGSLEQDGQEELVLGRMDPASSETNTASPCDPLPCAPLACVLAPELCPEYTHGAAAARRSRFASEGGAASTSPRAAHRAQPLLAGGRLAALPADLSQATAPSAHGLPPRLQGALEPSTNSGASSSHPPLLQFLHPRPPRRAGNRFAFLANSDVPVRRTTTWLDDCLIETSCLNDPVGTADFTTAMGAVDERGHCQAPLCRDALDGGSYATESATPRPPKGRRLSHHTHGTWSCSGSMASEMQVPAGSSQQPQEGCTGPRKAETSSLIPTAMSVVTSSPDQMLAGTWSKDCEANPAAGDAASSSSTGKPSGPAGTAATAPPPLNEQLSSRPSGAVAKRQWLDDRYSDTSPLPASLSDKQTEQFDSDSVLMRSISATVEVARPLKGVAHTCPGKAAGVAAAGGPMPARKAGGVAMLMKVVTLVRDAIGFHEPPVPEKQAGLPGQHKLPLALPQSSAKS